MAIRRFAVLAVFEGDKLTAQTIEALASRRSMHVKVVSPDDPIKLSVTATATDLPKAISALATEVSRVAPDATLTRMNAVEVTTEPTSEIVGVAGVS